MFLSTSILQILQVQQTALKVRMRERERERERERFHILSSTAGADYTPVSGLELVFNGVITDTSVSVSIIDDGIFELAERFNGLLTSTSLPANVMLDPDVATGTILEEGGQ